MDYEVDLDPTHSVIRLTVTAEVVTFELAEDIYRHLSEVDVFKRPLGARAKGCLGHPLCAGCRPVQPECPWSRLEVEAIRAVDSSHVPMLSQPGFVIDVIRAAAKGVQGSSATA